MKDAGIDDTVIETLEAALASDRLPVAARDYATHLLRADWEEARPADSKTEKALLYTALAALPRADAVVLSER